MARTVSITYGIGYGRHSDSLEVEDDATEEEIEAMVQDIVMEKLDWGYEVADNNEPPER